MLRNVVKLRDEEPDARIVHIRICGGPRSRRPGATRPLEYKQHRKVYVMLNPNAPEAAA